jgi:hypothetical protein
MYSIEYLKRINKIGDNIYPGQVVFGKYIDVESVYKEES